MGLHISQCLASICGTTSTASTDLNLHLLGECSNVSYEVPYECLNSPFTLLALQKSFPNQTKSVRGLVIAVPCPFPSLKGTK